MLLRKQTNCNDFEYQLIIKSEEIELIYNV